jgi:hypothetical protein
VRHRSVDQGGVQDAGFKAVGKDRGLRLVPGFSAGNPPAGRLINSKKTKAIRITISIIFFVLI